MSAEDRNRAVVMIAELAQCTEAMIGAGVVAALEVTTRVDVGGRRRPRMATTAEEYAAVWRAMLKVKLDGLEAL